jgi:hypothetical protein
LSKQPAADTIVGMFLVLDSADHEHFGTGEIVAAVGNCYLIQFDRLELDQPQPPADLYTLEELSGSCERQRLSSGARYARRAKRNDVDAGSSQAGHRRFDFRPRSD